MSRSIGLWFCAALLAALPAAGRASDLLEAYAQALRADPVLAGADATRWAVHENVAQARAPLLPQLSAGFGFDQSSVGATSASDAASLPSGRNSTRSASANLNQVIVDVSKTAQLRVAHAQSDAQDAVYAAALQNLAVRVATAYFNVLSAGDTLAYVQANEDAYGQQVEQSATRYANGLSAQVDVEQARSYYAAARASTIAARTQLADAREALAEITGTPAGTLKTLRDELPTAPPAPADAQAWVETALATNPGLRAQQLGVTAAERSIDAARAGHLPTLTAGVGIGRSASWPMTQSDYDGRTVTTVGVTLNVPLFAGGATQSLVRQALHQRDGAQDTYEAQRRALARTTLDQYRSVVAGVGRIEATKAAVDAARKALASTRVGQQLGTQTMTDLLLAIQNLTSAQGAYSAARHQFILDKLLLLQAAGTIAEADLAAVNALLQ
ncbi:MAG: TolC family outer membrane protein [Proteobacteria bacterium]|nr:TolC family outer membrane protein [Pseudomonadota bacterium]